MTGTPNQCNPVCGHKITFVLGTWLRETCVRIAYERLLMLPRLCLYTYGRFIQTVGLHSVYIGLSRETVATGSVYVKLYWHVPGDCCTASGLQLQSPVFVHLLHWLPVTDLAGPAGLRWSGEKKRKRQQKTHTHACGDRGLRFIVLRKV